MKLDFRRDYRDLINLKVLNETQWLTEKQIEELQLKALRRLISHAKEKTQYYKNYGDLPKKLEDLKYYPILTKADIKSQQTKLIAKGVPSRRQWTAGTSEQVTIFKNKDGKFLRDGKNRFDSWFATRRGREACIWGELKYTEPREVSRLPPINKVLFMPITNLVDETSALRYLKLIKKFKPVQLRGYATALAMLAFYALKHNIVIPSIKVAISNCEPLIKEIRILIQQAFRCPVFNLYGSRDLGSMAQDCEQHRGLHVFAEKYFIEITKDGRFLFTDLLNYAFPLIRYENGDTGSFSSSGCTCGRGLPVLNEIIGRKHCWILLPKNKMLHSIEINHYLVNRIIYHNIVYPFQIVQEEIGKITLLFQPWDKNKKIEFAELKNHFRKKGLEIKIETVKSMPRYGTSEKTLTYVNKLKLPWEK